MKKKRFTLTALTVLLSLSLAACGGGNNEANETNANKADTPDKTAEKVTLKVLTNSVKPEEFLAKFHKDNPTIEVNWEQVEDARYSDVIRTRFTAGEDLDIVTPKRPDFYTLTAANQLMDLSDQKFLDRFDPSGLTETKMEGKTYAVPMSRNVLTVWYNKDLFKANNLTEPKDWEEFLAVSEALKGKGVAPIAMAAKDAQMVNLLAGMPYLSLLSEDTSWYSKLGKGEAKWTDAKSVAALEKFKTIVDKKYFQDGALGTGEDQAYQIFYQGKAAMFISGSWAIDKVTNNKPAFEVGAFLPPGNDKGQTVKTAYAAGNFTAISANSKHKEAALTFLDYVSQPENASLYANNIKFLCSVKGVELTFSPDVKLVEPLFEAEGSQINIAFISGTMKNVLAAELQKMISGGGDAAKTAATLQAEQDKEIK
ncbi:hypothetical protein SY83_09990 [Paenibacillus swuensis]|uniref:ABC transporter substrate-binding protein n=1 Tax=Paenibacillus swuensis TaxID=1178515 RepID=A0A172TID9_9BACL|nr:sugar ABC transporter substrate-binding protein [Paenibacillus swuensis]ANE46553.1 hypothetical protein SY83_09990 [Paenibacillus swuensis]